MAEPTRGSGLTLIEALIATADPPLWQRYCRLSAELSGAGAAQAAVFAIGSVEWQRQQRGRSKPGKDPLEAEEDAAGRRRLAQRGAPPAFAGVPSPFGAMGGRAFDEFTAGHRGPPALLAAITAVESQLVDAFENAGRTGRYGAVGFCGGVRTEVEPGTFAHITLDFTNNQLILPDGSTIVGLEVTLGSRHPKAAVAGRGPRERKAKAMLRGALVTLWERGAFTAGTGNERVLALVLRELGLSLSDPPYGFKSAETIRKLRRELKMSL